MNDLEYYIYHGGYGPTNETLGKFIRELFGQEASAVPRQRARQRPSLETHRSHPPGH